MESQKKQTLVEGGINIDAALERFMGNETLLEKYLGRFLTDKSYTALVTAMNEDNREAASMAAHTFKSVCGTLGCSGLQQMVVDQEAAMKAGDWDKAVSMMPEIKTAHDKICAVLSQFYS